MNKLKYTIIKTILRIGFLAGWMILMFGIGKKCNANIATQSDWFTIIVYTIMLGGIFIESLFDDLKEHINDKIKVLLLDLKMRDLDKENRK